MDKEANQRGEVMYLVEVKTAADLLSGDFWKREKNQSIEEMEKEKYSNKCVAD